MNSKKINSNEEASFWKLLEAGGIYHSLKGSTVQEVLDGFVDTIRPGKSVQKGELLKAVLEREALMSTSIGNGIAIPHPRNPIVDSDGDQFAALAFLEQPVDWNALDGNKVDTIILLVSASAKSHLKTLSAISFFSRQEDFLNLLKKRVSREDLIRYIKNTEQKWKQEKPI